MHQTDGRRAVGHKGLCSPVAGSIERSSIDSIWHITSGPDRGFTCWLKDGSSIRFRESDYLSMTPDQTGGYWFIGVFSRMGERTPINGKLNFLDIKDIETSHFNPGTTVLTIVGTAAVIGIIGIIAIASSLAHANFY